MDQIYENVPLSQASSVIAKDDNSRRALRKSCDRCHELKLRCDGRNSSRTPCQRCHRAFQTCVYSMRSARLSQRRNRNSRDYTVYAPRGEASAQQHDESAGGDAGNLVDPSCLGFMTTPLSATDEFINWSVDDWSLVMDASAVDNASAADNYGQPQDPNNISPGCQFLPDDFNHDQHIRLNLEPIEALWRVSQSLSDMLQSTTTTWHLQSALACRWRYRVFILCFSSSSSTNPCSLLSVGVKARVAPAASNELHVYWGRAAYDPFLPQILLPKSLASSNL